MDVGVARRCSAKCTSCILRTDIVTYAKRINALINVESKTRTTWSIVP